METYSATPKCGSPAEALTGCWKLAGERACGERRGFRLAWHRTTWRGTARLGVAPHDHGLGCRRPRGRVPPGRSITRFHPLFENLLSTRECHWMSQADSPVIGIDLGTTNSVVAAFVKGRVQVLQVEGAEILPSVVGLDAAGELLIGTPARNQQVAFPERTVASVKRQMGTSERF